MRKYVFAVFAALSLTMCTRAVVQTRDFMATAKSAQATVMRKENRIENPLLAFVAQSGEHDARA